MFFSITTCLLWAPLLSVVIGQTPPGFSPETSNKLVIEFDDVSIRPGTQIAINVPVNPPTLELAHIPLPTIETFLFTLIDPDAPFPDDPTEAQFLHWLLPGIPAVTSADQHKGNFVLDTTSPTPFVPYVNPTPPNTSPAHRYVGLLFSQPKDFVIPESFEGFSAANRSNFNVTVFAQEAGLGNPVFASWFLVSNQTVFPGDRV